MHIFFSSVEKGDDFSSRSFFLKPFKIFGYTPRRRRAGSKAAKIF